MHTVFLWYGVNTALWRIICVLILWSLGGHLYHFTPLRFENYDAANTISTKSLSIPWTMQPLAQLPLKNACLCSASCFTLRCQRLHRLQIFHLRNAYTQICFEVTFGQLCADSFTQFLASFLFFFTHKSFAHFFSFLYYICCWHICIVRVYLSSVPYPFPKSLAVSILLPHLSISRDTSTIGTPLFVFDVFVNFPGSPSKYCHQTMLAHFLESTCINCCLLVLTTLYLKITWTSCT